MIIQKVDKKKLYINISLLVIIFGITIFFLFNSFYSGGSSGESVVVEDEPSEVKINVKYPNLKKIDLSIIEDDRYRELQEPVSRVRPELKIGNPAPFSSK